MVTDERIEPTPSTTQHRALISQETPMLTKISDIYDAKIGDKIILDKDVTVVAEIYAEAVANGKWVSVLDHLINDTYIAEVLDPAHVTNKDITNNITLSEYYGVEDEGQLALLIPEHINLLSLKSRFYTQCKGYNSMMFERHIIITKKVNSVNTSLLLEDFKKGDTKKIVKRDCKNVKSTMSSLYRLASDNNIIIRIKNGRTSIDITHMGIIDDSVSQASFSSQLHDWLNELPYDMTVSIPDRFTDVKSLAYINTVLNKSKFNCKCRSGKITKLSGSLKKSKGTIFVMVREKIVRVIDKPSLTNLDARDRKLINLALKPHNKTYEDVR